MRVDLSRAIARHQVGRRSIVFPAILSFSSWSGYVAVFAKARLNVRRFYKLFIEYDIARSNEELRVPSRARFKLQIEYRARRRFNEAVNGFSYKAAVTMGRLGLKLFSTRNRCILAEKETFGLHHCPCNTVCFALE